jgi:tRNA nucleotidyltransferase (CCA-adding enzyme)
MDEVRPESREVLWIDDIDLVVDGFHEAATVGAGVELARSLRQNYPQARLEIHGKFQTAALLWHNDPGLDSLWVDIATARTEFYPYPAANPEVEASSIRQDLYRRDFTINALAIRLTPPRAGEILDFFGGLLDLQERQIRVLHANSFIEDPTRIYRAVRFAVRLGFQIDAQTEGYIRHAIASGIYRQVQAELSHVPALQTRLKSELKYILQSPYWQPALMQLADLGALQCIHPTLVMTRDIWRQLRLVDRWLKRTQPGDRCSQAGSPSLPFPPLTPWLMLLEVLLTHLAAQDRSRVADNLQLPADSIERLQQLDLAQSTVTETLLRCDRPSQIVNILKRYDLPMLLLIGVCSQRAVRRQIWRYVTHWSGIKPDLNGDDLKAMGYKAGPHFKQILDRLSAATLDGDVGDRAEAELFLATHFPVP